MNRVSKYQVFTVVMALCLTVIIYWMPKTPLANSNSSVDNITSPTDATLTNEAIELVLNGEQPMKGIVMLREALDKDSSNKSALLALGLFSIQSGQFDKATDRFTSIKYSEANYTLTDDISYIAKSYQDKGIMMETIQSIENFKTLQEGNQKLIELLNSIIKEFKTYK